MASLNKVFLVGNLTRDPELRVTAGNLAICKFGLAVNRTYRTKDGEKREEATFIDIDSFGPGAETIAKYMTKGQSILIEGRLQLDNWETSAGEKRSKLKVVCENFQFLGGRPSGESGSAEAVAPPRHDDSGRSDLDDDVPF